jgi:hypothetical protein
MIEFHKYLDIPPPPESMIRNAEKSIYKNLHRIDGFNEGHKPETVTINGSILNYGQYLCDCQLPAEDQQWFNDNVVENKLHPVTAHFSIRGDLYPHVDQNRQWGLNWCFKLGGDNVETYWAQEDGQSVYRDQISLNHYRYSTNLTELHSFVARPNCWWLIRTNVIHGTRGQTSDRGSITVGISESQYNTLINKFKTIG